MPRLLRLDNSDRGLFYGDAHNLVAAPSGVGKSWVQAIVCLQEIQRGNHVVIIDYEMIMQNWFTRLRALGATDTELALVHYCQPDEALGHAMYKGRVTTAAVTMLTDELERISELGSLTWVVVDGVTNAMTQNELSLLDNQDAAEFWRLLPQRIVKTTGAGVGLNDHVPKNAAGETASPLGAQHKVANTSGSAFVLRGVSALSRTPLRDGVIVMGCKKDRHGQVGQQGTEVAQAILTPEPGGTIGYQVLPYLSDAVAVANAEREKVLQAVRTLNERGLGASLNQVAAESGGKNKGAVKAQLEALQAQGRAVNRGTQSKQNWQAIEPDIFGAAF
jgi:hypothetical protein